jgi:fumarylacetoacetate (FAA) hydrolase
MKLASLKETGRDGALIVVSRDLSRAVRVSHIAETMQDAIENWAKAQPILEKIYEQLNSGQAQGSFAVDFEKLESPFPRAYQFLDGSVYLHHMEKARKARGAEMPPNYKTEPLMYQGLSDRFIGPRDPMLIPDESLGLDYEAELAVVVDDVPMGTPASEVGRHIKLLMLLNDYTLRTLTRSELPKGFGFMQAKPTSSFSPVAVTPDELAGYWDGEKLDRPILSFINNESIGCANTGRDMFFTYTTLIAHAARTRSLSAGTIIGAGAVSNLDSKTGYACLAEKRADEELRDGKATTSWLKFGDQVRIDMVDDKGASIFGAIDNTVAKG